MDGIAISLKNLLPEPTPSEKARREIESLADDEDLQKEAVIGGPTPKDMQERNAAKDEEYKRRKLAIIAKYDVFGEHLAPLHRVEARLMERLDAVRRDIAYLTELRNKQAQSGQ